MDEPQQPGFYGKLPHLGDFASRRLSPAFIGPWDEWLQTCIVASRDAAGDAWLDLYLTSPIWRFALSAGVSGAQPWAGLLMPSVDSAGRYFPLTLATPLPGELNPLQLPSVADQWFARAEEVMLSALDEGSDSIDAFDGLVAALGLPVIEERHACSGKDESKSVSSPADADADPGDTASPFRDVDAALLDVLWRLISQSCTRASLWWSVGSAHVSPCLVICDGLPEADSYLDFLDGQWRDAWWEHWRSALPQVTVHRLVEMRASK